MATTPLHLTMNNDGPAIFYDQNFRNVIEQHLEYLKSNGRSSTFTVEPKDAYKYEADFFGLLTKLQVRPQYQWIALRLNDMHTPTEYRMEQTTILLPNESQIEKIRSTYTTLHKIG